MNMLTMYTFYNSINSGSLIMSIPAKGIRKKNTFNEYPRINENKKFTATLYPLNILLHFTSSLYAFILLLLL